MGIELDRRRRDLDTACRELYYCDGCQSATPGCVAGSVSDFAAPHAEAKVSVNVLKGPKLLDTLPETKVALPT